MGRRSMSDFEEFSKTSNDGAFRKKIKSAPLAYRNKASMGRDCVALTENTERTYETSD
jgi:hypothetical protein